VYTLRSDHSWTADPNHPRWDETVGYSHAASIVAMLQPVDLRNVLN
jgi:hypothetical protein